MFDVRNERWSQEFLNAIGISPEILPSLIGSVEVSGQVSRAVADELGIPAGTPVVGGAADNAAGAVGSGVVTPGRVQSSIGTSGALVVVADSPSVDEEMRLHTFNHAAPGRWYMMGVVLSAGNALRWLRDIYADGAVGPSFDEMTSSAENTRIGADGLIFMPYLTGERTPHNDANARGVFFGLHLGHKRGHLVRAVMEGVCFALRDSLEIMRQMGTGADDIRAIGGGARSRLWRQMQADVFDAPVSVSEPAGGPSFGAAILAAVGGGLFPSIDVAVDAWVRKGETLEPDRDAVAAYQEIYGLYTGLYPALKAPYAEAAAMTNRLGGS